MELPQVMTSLRPEYIYNPRQIIRRLAYRRSTTSTQAATPWGSKITFDANELHGRAMRTLGLSDLRTCEMISRILQPGDRCADIGANIGIMSSLMAKRCGERGEVHCFEPHPKTREILTINAETWETNKESAKVFVHPYAVSSTAYRGILAEPADFARNSGVATLEKQNNDRSLFAAGAEVECVSFDTFFSTENSFRLVKIDVEGHEDAVLAGMVRSLTSRKVQFIIFEEHRSLPSRACEIVEEHGYHTYLIDRNFWGPTLVPTSQQPGQLVGEATNILAVLDPNERDRLTKRGWTCLRA